MQNLKLIMTGASGFKGRHLVSQLSNTTYTKIILDYEGSAGVCGWIPRVTLREGLENLLKLDYRT
jgi:hypothetical protein